MKTYLTYFKNKDSNAKVTIWSGMVAFGFIGWLFGGGISLATAQNEMHSFLLWASLIFPALGLISWFIQSALGMKYYFVPTLINLAISVALSMWLIVAFTLAALYSLLSLYWWLGISSLSLFLHGTMWYYNQLLGEPFKLAVIKLYYEQKDGIDLQKINQKKVNKPVHPAPSWLVNMAIYGMIFGVVILGMGYFSNKIGSGSEPFVPYLLAWGASVYSLIMTMMAAKIWSRIRPAINAAKQIQTEKSNLNKEKI
jgi:hypothetical protein